MLFDYCCVILVETVDDLISCQIGLGIFKDYSINESFVPEPDCAISCVECTRIQAYHASDFGDGVEDLTNWRAKGRNVLWDKFQESILGILVVPEVFEESNR